MIIAGPCSIEKKEQLYNLMEKIHHNIDVLRAGIWKARTSPSDYPGIGEIGLPWLKDIQQKYKTPVAIEVGITKHVELALKHNIKYIFGGEEAESSYGGSDKNFLKKFVKLSENKKFLLEGQEIENYYTKKQLKKFLMVNLGKQNKF